MCIRDSPRTESVTSSTANNPPQSVRDEVESEPKENAVLDIDQQLEDAENNDITKQGSETVQPASTDEPLPGGWSTGSTLEKDQISDSDADSIKKTPILETQDKVSDAQGAEIDIPAIQDLKLEDTQVSSEDEKHEQVESSAKNVSSKPDTPEFVNQFEHITHQDLDENVFHDASSVQPFDSEESAKAPVGNDEWDEIFSGLGNNGNTIQTSDVPASVTPTPLQHPVPSAGSLPLSSMSKSPIDRGIAVTPKSLAIEELSSCLLYTSRCV